jgi:hypothetical protein
MGILFDRIACCTIRSPFHYPTMPSRTAVKASRATILHRFSSAFDKHNKMLFTTKNKRWIPTNVCYKIAELFLYVIQQLQGHQDWFAVHRYKTSYVRMNLWFYVWMTDLRSSPIINITNDIKYIVLIHLCVRLWNWALEIVCSQTQLCHIGVFNG